MQPFTAPSDAFCAMFARFLAFVADPDAYDDRDVHTSPEAAAAAIGLLTRAEQAAGIPCIGGHVTPDGTGGFRAEWRTAHRERCVWVMWPGCKRCKRQLYHREGAQSLLETDVTPQSIGRCLRWISEAAVAVE